MQCFSEENILGIDVHSGNTLHPTFYPIIMRFGVTFPVPHKYIQIKSCSHVHTLPPFGIENVTYKVKMHVLNC
jgi:hypothetical protein